MLAKFLCQICKAIRRIDTPTKGERMQLAWVSGLASGVQYDSGMTTNERYMVSMKEDLTVEFITRRFYDNPSKPDGVEIKDTIQRRTFKTAGDMLAAIEAWKNN